jgi:hypothetical protein
MPVQPLLQPVVQTVLGVQDAEGRPPLVGAPPYASAGSLELTRQRALSRPRSPQKNVTIGADSA